MSPTGRKVLILAPDPLLAALIGGLVELARLEPVFATDGEAAEDALTRVKPLAAILADLAGNESGSDLFVARARRRGVSLILFGAGDHVRTRRDWAAGHGLPVFELPDELEGLDSELRELGQREIKPRTKVRREAKTSRNSSGTLIYDDGFTKWSVYDRRTGERRGIDRSFVSESGEVRHVDLSDEEARSITVAALGEQLSRAH